MTSPEWREIWIVWRHPRGTGGTRSSPKISETCILYTTHTVQMSCHRGARVCDVMFATAKGAFFTRDVCFLAVSRLKVSGSRDPLTRPIHPTWFTAHCVSMGFTGIFWVYLISVLEELLVIVSISISIYVSNGAHWFESNVHVLMIRASNNFQAAKTNAILNLSNS